MLLFNRLRLFWRVFTVNAVLLVVVLGLLVLAPVTVSAPIRRAEIAILVGGFIVVLAADLLLLWRAFTPLERLARAMDGVDLLQPGQRLPAARRGDLGRLVRAFNRMLDRLEVERRESGRRALAAQEAERQRIARGLHDEVGQVLTGVLLQLDSLAAGDQAARRREVEETKQAVRQALEEVRRIARELRPEMLEQLGLVSALTELSRKFADQSGIRVERRFATDLPELSDEAEIAVYRVAQESLTNVARHAEASRVELTLQPGVDSVVLRVVDDGRGLPDTPAGLNGHTGLRGMRERALLVGGALAVK